MIHQVTLSVFSFSVHAELFSDCHIFVGPSDVISLAVSDVRSLRKSISLCHIFKSFT